jgi:hypothetical protein
MTSRRLGGPYPDRANPYGWVVENLTSDVVSHMQSRLSAEVAQSCAIGPLSHPSVNARCFRSKEGRYAIVLHHGLMNLLHKHSKLWVAAVNPSAVTYCNRKAPPSLTSQELIKWAGELGVIYRATGETKCALVELNHEGSFAASLTTTISEAFVLGHEMGHVLCGHLESSTRVVADDLIPSLQVLPESASHHDEFEAKATRFPVFCRRSPMEPAGIEPATSCLQSRRSPS